MIKKKASSNYITRDLIFREFHSNTVVAMKPIVTPITRITVIFTTLTTFLNFWTIICPKVFFLLNMASSFLMNVLRAWEKLISHAYPSPVYSFPKIKVASPRSMRSHFSFSPSIQRGQKISASGNQ